MKSVYGEDRLTEISPIVQALSSKALIVKHHFMEVEDAFKGQLEQENPTFPDLLELLFSNGEKRQAFHMAKLRYEANIVAAAQASHSISDNLAHLIYTTFRAPSNREDRPKLERLNKEIRAGNLKLAIEHLLGLREYAYLKNFVNYNKHMSLVESRYQVDTPTDYELQHGVKFRAFRNHSEKWGEEFLNELKKIQSAHVQIGIRVNESIGSTLFRES